MEEWGQVSTKALARVDVLRRVTPKQSPIEGGHGRKAVGFQARAI